MITQGWYYDAMMYVYALSLLFIFSDIASPNRKAQRMGTGLLLFVWGLQTVYLASRIWLQKGLALFTELESLFLLGWLLVTISLALNRFYRIELFVFLVNIFGFAALAISVFSNPNSSPTLGHWQISDELLFVHVSLSVASYAVFVVSAVFSGMYLFLHRKLKEKRWSHRMQRMPSLEKIDAYALRAAAAGVPLLLTGMLLGLVWIALGGDTALFFDPKVVNSGFVLLAYFFYLFQRTVMKLPGNKLALWNLAACAVMLINYAAANLYSSFHQWS